MTMVESIHVVDSSDEESDLDNSNEKNSDNNIDDYPETPDQKCGENFCDFLNNFNIFLPGQPIECQITKAELIQRGIFDNSAFRNQLSVNRVIYTIDLKHAGHEWQITRKYIDFISLHSRLFLMSKLSKDEENTNESIPNFPRRIDFNHSDERIEERRRQLETYLKKIVSMKISRYNMEFIKFLEVSPLSFRPQFGKNKLKEGVILKFPSRALFNCCLPIRQRFRTFWQERWLVVKDGYIAYLEPINAPDSPEIEEAKAAVGSPNSAANKSHHFGLKRETVVWRLCKVILMDINFRYNFYRTGKYISFKLLNSNGKTIIGVSSEHKATEWLKAIDSAVSMPKSIDYIHSNRFNSFAPQRHNCQIQAFVDGGAYMYSVAKALEKAKTEILITGWWVCPEIFLKRPAKDGTSRLDLLLKKKAEEGVRICILIYKEISLALNLDSAYTARYFRKLHPNIHVLRHPDHLKGMVLLWSHHEKSVIIDQSIAFIGGVDICYGRWDTPQHRLLDIDKNENIESHMELDRWKNLTSQMLVNLAKREEEDEETLDDAKRLLRKSPITRYDSKTTANHFLAVNAVKKWKKGVENKNVLNLPGGQVGMVLNRQASRMSDVSNDEKKVKTRTIFMPSVGRVDILDEANDSDNQIEDNDQPPVVKNLYNQKDQEANKDTGALKKAKIKDRFRKALSKHEHQALAKKNIKDALQRKFTILMKHGMSADENSSEDDLDIHHNWLTRRRTIANQTVDAEIKSDIELETEVKELCSKYMFVGKDYVNWLVKDCHPISQPFTDLVNRFAIPRMPWHDAAAVVLGQPAQDYARHFIQRWNDAAIVKTNANQRKKNLKNWKKMQSNAPHPSPPLLIPMECSEPWISGDLSRLINNSRPSFKCSVQALRSAGTWSLGLNELVIKSTLEQPNNSFEEVSIVRAYVDMIANAEHYVYIENQFYITYCAPLDKKSVKYVREDANTPASLVNKSMKDEFESDLYYDKDEKSKQSESDKTLQNEELWNQQEVMNPIGDAIFKRIVKAYKLKQKFRVYIMLPFLGAFEGEVGRPSGASQHAILHYTRASLFQGETALFPRLRRLEIDPEEYVSVNALRKWEAWSEDRLACEMIYIHDKLMIVDDRRVIIGSANINDRSMVGSRDSELAMIIEDNDEESLIPTTFNGVKTLSGKFSRRFRRALMTEHLGILNKKNRIMSSFNPNLVNDPVCDEFFHGVWKATARNNSEIIENVFLPIPSNKLTTFKSIEARRSQVPLARSDPQAAIELLKEHRGHLEVFPENFLSDEYLAPKINTKEGIIPYTIWT